MCGGTARQAAREACLRVTLRHVGVTWSIWSSGRSINNGGSRILPALTPIADTEPWLSIYPHTFGCTVPAFALVRAARLRACSSCRMRASSRTLSSMF